MHVPLFESLPPLSTSAFFQMSVEVSKGKSLERKRSFLLPETSFIFPEDHFARVWICWHEEGIRIEILVEEQIQNSFFPEFRKGDSIELFIDTRDLKSAKTVHKFCHHIVILPQETNGVQIQEVTRFRMEDTRPLMDMASVEYEVQLLPSGYSVSLYLPKDSLFGFDPQVLPHMGFTYRINRFGKAPQHFSVSSSLFSIEQHPHLWASLKFIK